MSNAHQSPGPYLAWTTLANSCRRQRALRLAAVASLTIAGALAAAAVSDPRVRVLAAAGGSALAALAAWRLSARAPRPMQLLIDGRGQIWIRSSEHSASAAARAIFVSSGQVVLDSDRGPIAIWCDALGTAAFRRLVVLSRWRVERHARRPTDGQEGGEPSIGRPAPAQGEAAN